MRKIIRYYLFACIVIGLLGIFGSLIYFSITQNINNDEKALHTKFCYSLNGIGRAEPTIIVFEKKIAILLNEWSQNNQGQLEKELPFEGDEFYTLPVNARVTVVDYLLDSTIVHVIYESTEGGRLNPQLEGYILSEALHEEPYKP